MSVSELRRIIEGAFPALWGALEAVLAAILAMVPDDILNPPTLILTGPSASAKTTVLKFVEGMDGITYRSDRFTPRSFVSSAANVSRARLEQVDLLPRIRYQALITPELAPIFRGNDDALVDTFAILTALLDGEGLIVDSGTHGRRGYTGDYLFAWVGATTPLPTKVWRIMAQLGSRLFFYGMGDTYVTDEDLNAALVGTAYRDRVEVCRAATAEFLRAKFTQLGGVRGLRWNREADAPEANRTLMSVARLVVSLRGIVSVWQGPEHDLSYTPPNIETPYRALTCLYNLARGRALLYDRTHIEEADIPLIRHVALSSAPHERTRLVQGIVQNDGVLRTADAAGALGASLPNARRVMRALDLLGVALLTGSHDHAEGGQLTLRPQFRFALGLPESPDRAG